MDSGSREAAVEIQCDHPTLAAADSRWRKTTLRECAVINDSTYKLSDDWPFVNYLDTANLTENHITSVQHLIPSVDEIPSRARRKVRQGDIVYSTVRPRQRHYGVIRQPPENLLVSTGFAVLRGREGIAETSFLYWMLTQTGIVDYLQGLAEQSVSAFPAIKAADLGSLLIRLPSIPVQKRISNVLNALDRKIELNRRMSETLDAAVRALFKSWFVDSRKQHADQDSHPLSGSLSEYASLNPESWSETNRPEEVAYVDLSNTKWGRIEKVEKYLWRDAPSRARRVVQPGDTIVGTVRPGNGSFALIGKGGLTASTGFAVIRPKADFDVQFVWCAATSKENIERLAHLADGGAYPAVPADAIAATPVAIVDVAIRRKFSDVTAPLVANYLTSGDEARSLADMRDALLPKLLSGEIRIQDAEKIAEAAT